MFSRKKGYTLIELLVYLSVLTIIFSIFSCSYAVVSKVRNNAIINHEIELIHNFIINAKMTSRNDNITGSISKSPEGDYLEYRNKNTKISIVLEKVKIYNINTSSGSININGSGIIITPCTITVKDIYNKIIKITISVGGETIDIKT